MRGPELAAIEMLHHAVDGLRDEIRATAEVLSPNAQADEELRRIRHFIGEDR